MKHAHQISKDTVSDTLIVIPTLNEAAHIEKCIRSLANSESADIVVADGGSTDETKQIVLNLRNEFPQIRLLTNPDQIQSAGLNLAVARCAKPAHKYLIRCDAHALYPPDYVARLRGCLQETGAASVVVAMDAQGKTSFGQAAAWVADSCAGNGGAAHRGGHKSGWIDHGHHAAFDLAWFRRIGGYDESMSHNEDADFDHRLWKAGGPIWLETRIRITYFMRDTARALARQYFSYGAGRHRMLSKNQLKGRLRHQLPVINFLGQATGYILGLMHPFFLLWPLAYLSFCAAFSLKYSIETRTLRGLSAGIALFIIHNFWALGFLAPGRTSKQSQHEDVRPHCT